MNNFGYVTQKPVKTNMLLPEPLAYQSKVEIADVLRYVQELLKAKDISKFNDVIKLKYFKHQIKNFDHLKTHELLQLIEVETTISNKLNDPDLFEQELTSAQPKQADNQNAELIKRLISEIENLKSLK